MATIKEKEYPMRILQIDNDAREKIKKLIDYACEHKINEKSLRAMLAGKEKPVGDNSDYAIHLYDGFRIVYSIEEQPIGDCHHISISVDEIDIYPHPAAVEEILKEFGMKKEDSISVWKEDNYQAINLLQKVEGETLKNLKNKSENG